MQIIATADMLAADEDLREGVAAGLRDHFLAQIRLAGGVVLDIGHTLLVEQRLGAGAVTAELPCVNRNADASIETLPGKTPTQLVQQFQPVGFHYLKDNAGAAHQTYGLYPLRDNVSLHLSPLDCQI